MITVLVTGVGGGIGQGILKSLRRIQDLDIKIIAADMSPLAAGLYTGDLAVLIPPFESTNYIDEIIDVCRRESVDYYIPGTDVELEVCAQHRKRLLRESGTDLVVSPLSTIQIAKDKYETFQFLKRNEISHPKTYLAHQVDPAMLDYPVIIKPRIGWHSVGMKKVENENVMRVYLENGNDIVVQEMAGKEEDEYTCTIVNSKGKLSDPVVLRRTLRAGDTYRAAPVRDDVIEDYVIRIAKAMDIYGSINLQLRTDDGVPKLFEINCRFSGTTPFCSALGMNPVEFFLKADRDIPYKYRLRHDLTVLRAWSEVVVENEMISTLDEKKHCVPKVNDFGVL